MNSLCYGYFVRIEVDFEVVYVVPATISWNKMELKVNCKCSTSEAELGYKTELNGSRA